MTNYEEVDIWAGDFESEHRFQQFLSKNALYDEEFYDSEESISEFANSQDIHYYEEDLLVAQYSDEALAPSELFSGSLSEGFLKKLDSLASASEVPKVKAVILLFGDEILEPKNAIGNGFNLTYLGKIDCRDAITIEKKDRFIIQSPVVVVPQKKWVVPLHPEDLQRAEAYLNLSSVYTYEFNQVWPSKGGASMPSADQEFRGMLKAS